MTSNYYELEIMKLKLHKNVIIHTFMYVYKHKAGYNTKEGLVYYVAGVIQRHKNDEDQGGRGQGYPILELVIPPVETIFHKHFSILNLLIMALLWCYGRRIASDSLFHVQYDFVLRFLDLRH